MDEFLNPKSMLTPGVAGSLTMTIANALALVFPTTPPASVALGVAFLIGLIVMNAKLSLSQRLCFWVLNSLVIFSAAVGTNTLGRLVNNNVSLAVPAAHAQEIPRTPVPASAYTPTPQRSDQQQQFFKPWFESR